MPKRRNAGLGMARVTELVHEVAMDYQPNAVGAIGHVDVYPNSRNIIPGRCVFTIDIRSPSKETLDAMSERIEDGIDTIAEALDIEVRGRGGRPFRPGDLRRRLREGSARRRRRGSATATPTSSPAPATTPAGSTASRRRRWSCAPASTASRHNEAEEITKEWATAGANVLMHAVVETAEVVE